MGFGVGGVSDWLSIGQKLMKDSPKKWLKVGNLEELQGEHHLYHPGMIA